MRARRCSTLTNTLLICACVWSVANALSAVWLSTRALVEVDFETDTDRGGFKGYFDCTKMFKSGEEAGDFNNASIGEGVCVFATDSVLVIIPGYRWLPAVDLTDLSGAPDLEIKNNKVIKDTNGDAITGSTSITPPDDSVKPKPLVLYPEYVATCVNPVIDASWSYGGYGRTVVYSFNSLNVTHKFGAKRVVAFRGQYDVSVNVAVETNIQKTAQIDMLPVADPVPSVMILAPRELSLYHSETITLLTNTSAAKCYGGDPTLALNWSVTPVTTYGVNGTELTPVLNTTFNATTPFLRLPAYTFSPGVYTVTVVGSYVDDPSLANNASVTLTVKFDELQLVVLGGYREFERNAAGVLEATVYDPALLGENATYTWSCVSVDGGSCTLAQSALFSDVSGPAVNFGTNELNENGEWVVAVSAATPTRTTATVTHAFVVKNNVDLSVSVVVRGEGPGGSLPFVNGSAVVLNNKGFTLVATCDECSSDATYEWELTYGDVNRKTPYPTGRTCIFYPYTLYEGQYITVKVTAREDGTSGSASYNTYVHVSPVAPGVDTTPLKGNAGSTVFAVDVRGTASTHPLLQYKIGVVIKGTEYALSGWQHSSLFTATLPGGNYCRSCLRKLVCYVRDRVGGVTRAVMWRDLNGVPVDEKKEFSPESAIELIASAASAADPAAVVGVAFGVNGALTSTIKIKNECKSDYRDVRTAVLQSLLISHSLVPNVFTGSEVAALLSAFTENPGLINNEGRYAVLDIIATILLPTASFNGKQADADAVLALGRITESAALCGDGSQALSDDVTSMLNTLLASVSNPGSDFVVSTDSLTSRVIVEEGGDLKGTYKLYKITVDAPKQLAPSSSGYLLLTLNEWKGNPYAYAKSAGTAAGPSFSLALSELDGTLLSGATENKYQVDFTLDTGAASTVTEGACESFDGDEWETNGDCAVVTSTYGHTVCECGRMGASQPRQVDGDIELKGSGGLTVLLVLQTIVLAVFVSVGVWFGSREVNTQFEMADVYPL